MLKAPFRLIDFKPLEEVRRASTQNRYSDIDLHSCSFQSEIGTERCLTLEERQESVQGYYEDGYDFYPPVVNKGKPSACPRS